MASSHRNVSSVCETGCYNFKQKQMTHILCKYKKFNYINKAKRASHCFQTWFDNTLGNVPLFLKLFIWIFKILKTELILVHLKITSVVWKDGEKSSFTTSNDNRVSTNVKDCDEHAPNISRRLFSLLSSHSWKLKTFLFYFNFKSVTFNQAPLADPHIEGKVPIL